jgi:hypothetical protein
MEGAQHGKSVRNMGKGFRNMEKCVKGVRNIEKVFAT